MKFSASIATCLLGATLMAQPASPESAKLLADAQKGYASALKSQSPAMKTKVSALASELEKFFAVNIKISKALWKDSTEDIAFSRHFIYRDLTSMMAGRDYPGDMSMKFAIAKYPAIEKLASGKQKDPDLKRLSPADKMALKALIAQSKASANRLRSMSLTLTKTQQNWVGSIASGMLSNILGEG
jgi:hypothetical protein